jgi:nitrogen fixation protein NifU and related proteins
MSSLYTEIIQDAYRNPSHRGRLERPSHSFEDENPLCGDTLHIDLDVEDGRVVEVRFDGRGCAISQASAELVLDRVLGQPVEAVAGLDREDVLEELGIPSISPARLKCAMLSLKVLKGALYGLHAPGDTGTRRAEEPVE